MLKGDAAFGAFQHGGVGRVGAFLLLVQQLKGALGGSQRRLERVDHVGSLGQRLGGLVDILEERLHHAHRHGAGQHGMAGDDGDDHVGQPGQQADQRVDAVGQKVGLLVGGAVALGGSLHLVQALGLVVVGLDDVAAVVQLLHQAGQVAHRLLPLGGIAQVLFGDDPGDEDADSHEQQEDAGQRHAVIEHDDQRADDGADGHDQLEQAGLQYLGDLVQVAGDAAEHLAGFVLVEKAQGQAVELAGHLAAQGEHQALGHAGHQPGLEIVEQPGEQVLERELDQLPAHGPGDREGGPALPGGLDASPQVVDDDGAVHGVPDAQRHIDHDGHRHHRQPQLLALHLAGQAYHGAGALVGLVHGSRSSFPVSPAVLVWDS